jgi:diguanylate cyclase (GGDEF)-like protein
MHGFLRKRFSATIILPLLIASLAVAWLTFDLINRVSAGANEADRMRSTEIVDSALTSLQNQLSNTAVDNSFWDDAVRNTYGDINADWFYESWGQSSSTGINYDLMLVVDRAMPTAVAGFRKGDVFVPQLETYFDGKLTKILDRMPRDNKTSKGEATVLKTPDGLALVAVAPFVPTSSDITVPREVPRYIVLARFLTPEFIKAIGQQYVIADLQLIESTDTAGAEAKSSGLEFVNAKFIWKDKRPGDGAGKKVFQKAVLVLSFLGSVLACIGFFYWRLLRHISEKEELSRTAANHDELTGLLNRAALNTHIETLKKKNQDTIALAFLDLDGFKTVNDTYNHEVGDQLLKVVAAGFTHLLGGSNTLFRIGGDEFVMLFHGLGAEAAAHKAAENTIAFLAEPFDIGGRMANVGVSIGLAVMTGQSIEAVELLRRADVAMYSAKQKGKNRLVVYAEAIDESRVADAAIASKLRSILDAGSLGIAFQPIVSAATRKIVAVEALARWPKSEPEMITPDKFVAVAEEHGLIDALGADILAKACAAASRWPGMRVSINISPVQLNNPCFVSSTLKIIESSGIAPQQVELEITEGKMIADIESAKIAFKSLQAKGISIVLDDFGAGFSSIGYLSAFNFNKIKIDRSIIQSALSGQKELYVVQGAVLMAQGLAASVTAEGIEQEEQIEILRLSGCRELQGYYFSKPLMVPELEAYISHSLEDHTTERFAIAN